jgi:hypothetical protein
MRRSLCALPFVLIAIFSCGCASNPWQKSFQPNPLLEGQKFPPTDGVQVRNVEFERMQRYAEEEKRIRVESTTSPADYTPEERTAAKNRLLEALQLRERGDEIEVLGWSEVESTQQLDPRSNMLGDFAKSIGADYVVVSSEYLGRVMTTVDRPLTTYSHVYAWGRHGRAYPLSYSDTTWVPMNVIEDRFLYTAAYLRKMK